MLLSKISGQKDRYEYTTHHTVDVIPGPDDTWALREETNTTPTYICYSGMSTEKYNLAAAERATLTDKIKTTVGDFETISTKYLEVIEKLKSGGYEEYEEQVMFFTVNNTGTVGIGTVNPSAMLTINSNGFVSTP